MGYSHAVLPGVALCPTFLGYFYRSHHFRTFGIDYYHYIKGNSIIKSGTAIEPTFSSFLALGVILNGVASSTGPLHILFGISLVVQI